MFKKNLLHLDWLLRIALHGTVLFLAICLFTPRKTNVPRTMVQALWSGSDRAYIQPGSQFKIFKPYLHSLTRVSLILDLPNKADVKTKETSYDAQNYLAPVILSLETAEPAALVYCSTQALADQRLTETGYEWTHLISPGKGIAGKKP